MVETNLPVLILRDIILFPYNDIRVEITKSRDKLMLDNALKYNDNHILFINLLDPLEESPSIRDLPNVGVIGKIKSKIELSNGTVRIVVGGITRVEVLNYFENDFGYLESFVVPIRDDDYDEATAVALKRILFKDLNKYIDTSSMMSNSVLGRISGVDNIDKLVDIIITELPIEYETKLKYLREVNPLLSMLLVIEYLNK